MTHFPLLSTGNLPAKIPATVAFFWLYAFAILQSASAADTDNPQVKPVKLMQVISDDAGAKRTFFGRVSARQTVDLAFQVAGQITEFPAVEGALMSKDSLVAKLDPVPFELALGQAQANRQQAQRSLMRLEKLKDNASRAQVDDARTAVRLATLAVRSAQYELDNATLIAPFDAMVASRTQANFSTVGAGMPIVRLHDMSELHIEIDVPEILFQQLGDNPDVDLHAQFPVSDQIFPLEFRELNAEASRVGQTFRVTLGMAPPKDLLLLPGASVSVHATLLDQPLGITVPATAIHKDHDGSVSVMRYNASGDVGKVVKTKVTLAVNNNGDIQITNGVSDGDEIVVMGADLLTDGQPVRRFTSLR